MTEPDPIYAMIEKHRTARGRVLQLYETTEDGDDPRLRAAEDRELRVWRKLVRSTPRTLAGVTAFAAYVKDYPDFYMCEEAPQAVVTIAKALGRLPVSGNLQPCDASPVQQR